MKINFLGDSITAGAGAEVPENMYTTILCKKLNAEERNFGICGTRIAKQTIPSDEPEFDETFLERAKRMDKDADLVIVFGGTNDYGHGDAMMGDMDSEDEFTFYGAFKTLVNYLADTYGKDKLVFIMPLPRFNQDSIYGENGIKQSAFPPMSGHMGDTTYENLYPLSDYIEAEKKILDKAGIKYLDFAGKFPLPESNTGDDLTTDGLHPNIKGHEFLANLIADELKNFSC